MENMYECIMQQLLEPFKEIIIMIIYLVMSVLDFVFFFFHVKVISILCTLIYRCRLVFASFSWHQSKATKSIVAVNYSL